MTAPPRSGPAICSLWFRAEVSPPSSLRGAVDEVVPIDLLGAAFAARGTMFPQSMMLCWRRCAKKVEGIRMQCEVCPVVSCESWGWPIDCRGDRLLVVEASNGRVVLVKKCLRNEFQCKSNPNPVPVPVSGVQAGRMG